MANSINLDTAERLDITCRRGDSFALDLDVTSSSGEVLNMTGYTFDANGVGKRGKAPKASNRPQNFIG